MFILFLNQVDLNFEALIKYSVTLCWFDDLLKFIRL